MKISKNSGFSLVEILVALVVGTIIMAAMYSTLAVQRKIYRTQEQVTEMILTARAAIDTMSREIRMAGYDPTGNTGANIPYNASQLQIQADLNGDGRLEGQEDITYSYYGRGMRILRNIGSGNQQFALNIEAFTFEYLDGSGATTTKTEDIRQVRITITARTEKPDPDFAANDGYRTCTLTTVVTPKNLAL